MGHVATDDDPARGGRAVRIAGVILAGGRATRMGGADKALVPLAGRPLVAHVASRLTPQVAALALSANGDPARFDDLRLPVLADTVPGHPGPLAGVLAGLGWAEGQGASHLATAAVDTPFFPSDLVARLARALAAGRPAAVAATREGARLRDHPTFGLWPVGLGPVLARALTVDGMRKAREWVDAADAARVVVDDAGEPFFNVNTPEDLAEAARRLGV